MLLCLIFQEFFVDAGGAGLFKHREFLRQTNGKLTVTLYKVIFGCCYFYQ